MWGILSATGMNTAHAQTPSQLSSPANAVGAGTRDVWRTHAFTFDDAHGAADLTDREWLLTNGTGAYAMGTVPGCNTRRYHGLLVAAATPPVGRIVALNQMLERIDVDTSAGRKRIEFGTCMFHAADTGQVVFVPDGHAHLQSFENGLNVRWRYVVDGITLTRQLTLHWKRQSATIGYTIGGLPPDTIRAVLHLSPMITLRDYHSLLSHSNAGAFDVRAVAGGVCVTHEDDAVTLTCEQGAFEMEPDWWYDIWYPRENEREQDDGEDYFVPGRFSVALTPGECVAVDIHVALGELAAPLESKESDCSARNQHLHIIHRAIETLGDELITRALTVAADDFVVDRAIAGQTLSTIIAGYPWFADWGRDTFIALPGLMLVTHRFDEAKRTLRVFAERMRGGLVPNRFDDYDDSAAHFNTVDASLWFVNAAMRYVQESNDVAVWQDWLGQAVCGVLDAYECGTDFDIHMDDDGLIAAGSPDTQLTWMDAARDGVVFTPRYGKAVEINALWYDALVGVAELESRYDESERAAHYTSLANRAKRSFRQLFWNKKHPWLNDCVWLDDRGHAHFDATLRPNQILAASLPHSPLGEDGRKAIVNAVREHLLTPYGLCTLPPNDCNYHGRYEGSMFERDGAYHQGTVWPWLIGPYAEAVLRAGAFSKEARRTAREAVAPLLKQLCGGGLGQLHEVHDGDPPHHPGGCMAQAWSVAEVLRLLRLIAQAWPTQSS
ncbi:MAG: hypothetical protein CMJ49_08460 [Planctomycetaceae bacterium]|nr:hypothetical protein [Planctomycetaceae bacterium]